MQLIKYHSTSHGLKDEINQGAYGNEIEELMSMIRQKNCSKDSDSKYEVDYEAPSLKRTG